MGVFQGNSGLRRFIGPRGGFLLLLGVSILLVPLFSSPAISQKRDGVYHPISKGVTLYRISQAYGIPIARLMEINRISSPSAIRVGQKIFIPGAKKVLTVDPYVPLSSAERKNLERSLEVEGPPPSSFLSGREEGEKPPWLGKEVDIIWPIQGKINSPYGPRRKEFHSGIDIGSPNYQEVKAAMDGEVIFAHPSNTGYGNLVVLRHDRGFSTIYGHLNVIIAREGEAVRQGQAIGGVGSTGKSTGPHLHFEVRHDGHPLDPLPLLPQTIEEFLEKASKK